MSKMQIRIRPGAKNHTEAFARFHRVACDKPFDDGGGDTGMTPEELMLSALGCSAMQRAAAYLRSRGLSLDGVELRVSAEPAESGLGEIAIDVEAPGLTARKREAILKSIDASPIYHLLVNPQRVRLGMLTAVAEKDAAAAADGETSANLL
jgi:putative redox protein